MTQPPEQPWTAALITAGEELFAIAYAALLQDAVDNHLTNEAMVAWTRAVAAARKAEAAAPDPVASPAPLDVTRLIRALWHLPNATAWLKAEADIAEFALAIAREYEGQPVAEEPRDGVR